VIEAEPLRDGRSTTQIRARLSQDGQACVEALLTTSTLDTNTVPYWDRGVPQVSQVPYEDCDRLKPQLPDGSRVTMIDQIELRLEPDSRGFTTRTPSGRGELRGWLALPEHEAFDPTSSEPQSARLRATPW
jgi:Thioesterase-like superfamily